MIRNPNGNGSLYQSWCNYCCGSYHPLMLTGYCISSRFDGVVCRCDNCGRGGDLAMVKVEANTEHDPTLHQALARRGYTSRKGSDEQRRDIFDASGTLVGSFTASEAWLAIAQGRIK